jgi:hypothetical protein
VFTARYGQGFYIQFSLILAFKELKPRFQNQSNLFLPGKCFDIARPCSGRRADIVVNYRSYQTGKNFILCNSMQHICSVILAIWCLTKIYRIGLISSKIERNIEFCIRKPPRVSVLISRGTCYKFTGT